MASSSSSSAQVRYKVETVEGTIPSTAPQLYRITKESLGQTIESQSSKELRADRQMVDSTIVSGSAGGNLDWEFSFKTHDDFLEALLSNTYVTAGTNGVKAVTDAVFNSTTHVITSTGNQLPLLERGQWFQIYGAGNANNNGIFRASSSVAPTTGSITVDTAVKDVTTASSGAISVATSRLKNGNAALKTFSIEKCFSDVSQYFMMTGAAVTGMNLGFNLGSALDGSFSFLGRQVTRGTSSMFPAFGATVPATTTPMINTVNNTVVLLDGTSLGESCAESFSFSVSTGAKEKRCLGSGIGLSGITQGTYDIKGTLNIYFGASTSAAVYDKMRADQPISFSISCADGNGNGYAITLERAKISTCKVEAGGMNTDVIMSMEITATVGPVSGAMLIIDRLGSIA